MKLAKQITVCEVGLRDGMQIEKRILTVTEKLEMIHRLEDAGVTVIEVGSFMSPKAVPQMANTDEVFQKLEQKPGVEYRTLVANLKGVERAIRCGCKKVKLNISASKGHNLANLNRLPLETMKGFQACAEAAYAAGVQVSGSIACPFGSPWDPVIPVADIKEIIDAYLHAGVNEISISDAPGMAMPAQVYQVMTELTASYPQCRFILHFHNTRGMGIANVMAGMEAGITWFDGSLAGTGGCPFIPGAAGNVSTEDIVHMALCQGVETGIDLKKLIEAGRRLEDLMGHRGDSYVLRAGTNQEIRLNMPAGQLENQTLKHDTP